jgi:hypothetical protein
MDIGFSLCSVVLVLQTGAFQSSNQTLAADDPVDLGMVGIYVGMQCQPLVTGLINTISVGEVTIE